MSIGRSIGVAALLVLAALVAQPAAAQTGWGQWGAWGGYYGGLNYNVYTQDPAPYFALHPPVYYSRPVPRPYGYSPFAYPPYIMTPEPKIETPVTILNPHAPRSTPASRSASTNDRTTHIQPLRITNPYVIAGAAPTDKPAAPVVVSRPHTIYPSAGR
jgi:hypothetical protein